MIEYIVVFVSFYDGVNGYRFICTDLRIVGKAHASSHGAVLVDLFVDREGYAEGEAVGFLTEGGVRVVSCR